MSSWVNKSHKIQHSILKSLYFVQNKKSIKILSPGARHDQTYRLVGVLRSFGKEVRL